jgi:hypothetical protein
MLLLLAELAVYCRSSMDPSPRVAGGNNDGVVADIPVVEHCEVVVPCLPPQASENVMTIATTTMLT